MAWSVYARAIWLGVWGNTPQEALNAVDRHFCPYQLNHTEKYYCTGYALPSSASQNSIEADEAARVKSASPILF